jgi:NAD(P)-dependent dehydrogenase (short-subunit alcohol dehydrogenase family)
MHSRKVAVITGAAQGIGRRTAELFAEQGYALALNDLRAPSDTRVAAERVGTHTMEFVGDISDEDTVVRFAKRVDEQFGRVDVLVNNAGVSSIGATESVSAAEFRRVLNINLVGPFLLSKAFGALMLARGVGAIVNVASVAGLAGVADRAAYNASKHGLVGLTRTLAAEWGGRGVRVNAVCPGWVKTEMDAADQANGTYTDADIENRVPMARFASPDDVGRAILFLADERASGFVNGHTLVVDGGWLADASWESLRLGKRSR